MIFFSISGIFSVVNICNINDTFFIYLSLINFILVISMKPGGALDKSLDEEEKLYNDLLRLVLHNSSSHFDSN